jgi:hypothetical protein
MVVTDNLLGNIYSYHGESSYSTVTTQCNSRTTSVLFDNKNQMIVLCMNSNTYVYYVNGTNTGSQINAYSSIN